MKGSSVTITIPTFNSAKTLPRCLQAITSQSYKNIEVSIIDGGSKDETLGIAKKFKVKQIIVFPGSLLAARFKGVQMAGGSYVLILDSDQILERLIIAEAVKKCERENLDMLALEEDVYKRDTFVEKLFDCDRKVINADKNLDPFTGVIMPRFFKRELLLRAYKNIPKNMFKNTGGPDHAIVYYEAWKISKKVGILKKSVQHLEPGSLFHLWRKFYRWGYTSIDAHHGIYSDLMKRKERFRTGLFRKGYFVESLGSVTLLILKGIAFKLGYYVAIAKKGRYVK